MAATHERARLSRHRSTSPSSAAARPAPTYARILSEQAPGATIAMFEVGPTVSDPPGAHVKNIADPERARRAQRRIGGTRRRRTRRRTRAGGIVKTAQRRARPGTFLLETATRSRARTACPSPRCRATSAAWPRTGPARARDRTTASASASSCRELDELLAEAERLLGVTTDAFDGVSVRRPRAGPARRGRGRGPRRRTTACSGCRSPCTVARTAAWCGRARTSCSAMRPATTRTSPCTTSRSSRGCSSRTVALPASRSPTAHAARATRCARATSSWRRMPCARRSCCGLPASVPTPSGRYLNDQAQIVFAVRIRDFVPAPQDADGSRQTGLSEYSGVTWVPFTDEMPFHGQVMQLDASPVPLADDDPAAPGLDRRARPVLREGPAARRPGGVRRRRRSTAYGMPAMTLHYTLTARDHEVIDRAQGRRSSVSGKAVGEPLDDRPFMMPLGASLHYQGTTRMGADRRRRERLLARQRGLGGARPVRRRQRRHPHRRPRAIPTLTGVALAVRGRPRNSRSLNELLLMSESDIRV